MHLGKIQIDHKVDMSIREHNSYLLEGINPFRSTAVLVVMNTIHSEKKSTSGHLFLVLQVVTNRGVIPQKTTIFSV